MVPYGMFDAPIVPKEGKTVKFELANGKVIDSMGMQTLECTTKSGYTFRIQCHVAPVERPIISSGLLLSHGVSTILEKNEAYLKPSSEQKMDRRRIRQTFVLDVQASNFARQ